MKACIFDMDGTLVDSMMYWENCGALYVQSQGKKTDAELNRILFSMSMEEGAEYLIKHYLFDYSKAKVINGIIEVLSDAYKNKIQLKKGALDFLFDMKNKKIPFALATATDRRLWTPCLERLGIADLFSFTITCQEAGASKEFPKIYIDAAKKMNVSPDDTVIFEDMITPIKTAKSAGFKVCAVLDDANKTDFSEIKKNADYSIENYENASKFFLAQK